MVGSALDGMYLNYHWPLTLVNLLNDLISNQQYAPNVPQLADLPVARVWFSQPRPSSDPTQEVLTVNFKLPLSVGEFSIEIMRVACTFNVWYKDRNNNWIQMRDENYQPMTITLSSSQEVAWYKYHVYTYPIVAKAVQFRISRNYDPTLGNQPFNIGLRQGLIRRNIYARSDGTQAMEPEQDALGNVIAKYIQDWDAPDAIDDKPTTFWKCSPQPDSQAVVSLYLDFRNPDGTPQLIDSLYLDPVYTNQNLNVYYSTDDTVGTRKLSPISLPPDFDENTQWTAGTGLIDISDPDQTSVYVVPMAIGPQISQPAWIGVVWTPNFDSVTDAPPTNPTLFGVAPGISAVQMITINGTSTGGSFALSLDGINYTTAPLDDTSTGDDVQAALEPLLGIGNIMVAGDAGGPWTASFYGAYGQQPVPLLQYTDSLTGIPQPTITVTTVTAGVFPPNAGGDQYWPTLYFDCGAVEVVLEFNNGSADPILFSAPLYPPPAPGIPLCIVAGWIYSDPIPQVFISVVLPDGTSLVTTTLPATNLPTQISFDGEVGYKDFQGIMSALVVKLDSYTNAYQAFQANPPVYVNPDPVQPDPHTGKVPSTTLDDAVLAVDWTLQDMPCGGGHASFYESKIWTPIFANYVTQKGKYYFPNPVLVSYLQLEFTNLTEEPYPVYDSGISVMYQVFPISVTQTQTAPPISAGILAVAGQILGGGIGSVNWLNANSINAAVNSIFNSTVSPITVQVGPGYTVSSAQALPNSVGSSAYGNTNEIASPWIYRRELVNTAVLASQNLNNTLYNIGSQVLNPLINSVTSTISGAFNSLINFTPSATSLPLQGTDYWVVPGQTLALAANVMTGLTQAFTTALNRKPATDYRLRFLTTSVHQYDIRTAVRDAAIAYSAGVREVSAFRTTYIATQDPPAFKFAPYDPNQWVFHNIVQLPSGPISTAGVVYQIQNPLFDTTLDNWDQAQGSWSIDPGQGKYQYGAATVTADGTEKELLSALVTAWPAVTPGANFALSVWVQWQDVISTGTPVVLAASYYDIDGNFLSQDSTSVAVTGTSEPDGGLTSLWASGGGILVTLDGQIPDGAAQLKIGLVVQPAATAGQFWFDTVLLDSTDVVEGTIFIDLITSSTFVKVDFEFTDSGTVRSDDMWAQADPFDTNISSTKLAYYTSTYPSTVPSGTWGDDNAKWADPTIMWGEPFAVVSINVDPNMNYTGKRVLHITRAAGYGEAGVNIRQVTGFVPNGLARLNCQFFKPVADGDQVILRLRRLSDGVYIYQYTFNPDKIAGFWYLLQTPFFEIPDVADQIYTLEVRVSGDAGGDFYLNDAWTDVAQIRYFARLRGEGNFLHDVTALRYAGLAIVSNTTPVNEVSCQAAILSPNAWAYGAVLVPNYLK